MTPEEIKAGLDKYMAGVEAKLNKPALKPCPFCGGIAKTIKNHGVYQYFVVCQHCEASVGNASGTRKEAEEVWNTRHEPPTPGGAVVPAGNERLKKVSKCL